MAIIKANEMDFSNEHITILLHGLPGVGKACADDTKVYTDMGYIPICEIKEGFKVYGEDGRLHNVVGVYPQGIRPSYKVFFNDGTSIICDEEHIWTVEAASGNSKIRGWQPYTVKQLLEKGVSIDSPSRSATGRKPLYRWKIPVAKPIEKPSENYYIDPYVMGVLLGDGCLSGGKPIFSNPDNDSEVMQKVESKLMPGYTLTKHEGVCPSYYIKSPNNDNKYAQALRAAGIDVCASAKKIPWQYMRGSVEQRTELLRGLMDTDGTAGKNRISYSTISDKLARDIVALVQSLGGIAKIHVYDRTDEQKSIEYDIGVRLNICPFSLARKAAEWHPTIISRYIEKIEKVDDVSCTCIMVDNPSSLFVLENCIVTHNTTLACSAPRPIVIDCDNGMRRVSAEHRATTSVVKTYEDVLADIKDVNGDYDTIVIDTCGSLIELMKQWVIDNKMCKMAASGFALQGYGIIKSEFARLMSEIRRKYNVVYIFHAVKEKTEDSFFYELLAEGATKATVWQPCDLGAFMYVQGGERYLGFTPSELYNAKSAYGIKGLVKIPELKDGKPNDFLTKLIATAKASLNAENAQYTAQKEEYDAVMAQGIEIIEGVKVPDDMPVAASALNQLKHVLTSKAELKSRMTAKMAELNIVYNGTEKKYEYKEQ